MVQGVGCIDSGVYVLGQVVYIDLIKDLVEDKVCDVFNYYFKFNFVVVLEVEWVSDEFYVWFFVM